jgi:hypothetical protein
MTETIVQNGIGALLGEARLGAPSESPAAGKASRVVFVDDDQILLDSFAFAFGRFHKVDVYVDPQKFLDSLGQYDDTVQFVIDYNFDNYPENGLKIADRLHRLKFTRIILMSGTDLSMVEIPDYLSTIRKTDVLGLGSLLAGKKNS